MNYYGYINYLNESNTRYCVSKQYLHLVIIIMEDNHDWSILFDKKTMQEVK